MRIYHRIKENGSFEICKFQDRRLKHVNSKIAILGFPFFCTISNYFLIQNISVASGCSSDIFEFKLCRKIFF